MEPKQICLYVHTAHGLPSAVCHTGTWPRDFGISPLIVTLTFHLGWSGVYLWVCCDFVDVTFSMCQQWMKEAKHDVIEEEHNGEEEDSRILV